jgi:hypothetical protein
MVPGDVLMWSGGDTWLEPSQQPVIRRVRELLDRGFDVAAVCGAKEDSSGTGEYATFLGIRVDVMRGHGIATPTLYQGRHCILLSV